MVPVVDHASITDAQKVHVAVVVDRVFADGVVAPRVGTVRGVMTVSRR